MIEIEHRVRIECPSEKVWAVLADIPGWPMWTPTVSRARRVSGVGRGARFVLKQPLQKPATWIVTDWEPGRSFTWERTGPPGRFIARHELVVLGAGTISLVRLRVDGPGAAMSTVMRPVFAAIVALENRALRTRCAVSARARVSA